MLTLIASLLLERRVVLVGQSRDTVSLAVQAASALLYPFKWHHIFLPILPKVRARVWRGGNWGRLGGRWLLVLLLVAACAAAGGCGWWLRLVAGGFCAAAGGSWMHRLLGEVHSGAAHCIQHSLCPPLHCRPSHLLPPTFSAPLRRGRPSRTT
jgi:hypothetical protein